MPLTPLVGQLEGNRANKNITQCFRDHGYWGPGLTWNGLQKNRLFKQNRR